MKNGNGESQTRNLISQGTRIQGDIDSAGDFRIEGYVNGTVKAKGKIVVGESGQIEGQVHCQSADISAELLNRVRQPFNVNSVALAAARAALYDEEHLDRAVEVNRHGMKQFTTAFERMGLNYIPSVGNFVSVDVGQPAQVINEALLRNGVIVRPVENYGMPNHLRVTVGLERENRRFLTALQKALSKGQKA